MVIRNSERSVLNLARNKYEPPFFVNMESFFEFSFWISEELLDLEAQFKPRHAVRLQPVSGTNRLNWRNTWLWRKKKLLPNWEQIQYLLIIASANDISNGYFLPNSTRRRPSCCCRRWTMLLCIWLTRLSLRSSVAPISFIVSSS